MVRLEEVLNVKSIMFRMLVNLERGAETDLEEVLSSYGLWKEAGYVHEEICRSGVGAQHDRVQRDGGGGEEKWGGGLEHQL